MLKLRVVRRNVSLMTLYKNRKDRWGCSTYHRLVNNQFLGTWPLSSSKNNAVSVPSNVWLGRTSKSNTHLIQDHKHQKITN